MSLTNYADLTTSIASWTGRGDYTATNYSDFTTIFEAWANRKLRVRKMETTAILVPSAPSAINISNAVSNGGLIRLTITSTSTLATGNEVAVANVVGTTEANTSWIITVIDGTTIDLQGSTFTNAYVSGGTVTAQAGIVALPSDYLQWRRVTWMSSKNVELEYVHPTMWSAYYPTRPAGTPSLFTIEGANLKVVPTSGTSLEFTYWQKIPTLVTNSTNWLMTAHPDLYLFGTLTEAYMFNKDPDTAVQWAQRRDTLADEIHKLDKASIGPAAIRIYGTTP